MEDLLHTPWGNARVNNDGYYYISSIKEGNRGKRLHRLIYENFYNYKIPKGFVIYHKDGNKLNNCILNLQLLRLTEHSQIHRANQELSYWKGKHLPISAKKKISIANSGKVRSQKLKLDLSQKNSTTGIFRVKTRVCPTCSNGFAYVYRYYENGIRKELSSTNLLKLKQKVLSNNLTWKIIDSSLAKKHIEKGGI